MSETSTATAPKAVKEGSSSSTLKDVIWWRRKNLSLAVLAISTATWFVIEILEYNFITVASWLGIFTVTSLFLWANLAPLFGKDVPDLSEWEVSEQTAVEAATTVRKRLEEVVQWVRGVIVNRDWSAFAQMVARLGFLSLVGSWFDFLTVIYIGILAGLTCPVIYAKYEDRIKGIEERLKRQGRRCCELFDEKVLQRIMRKRSSVKEKKEE